MRASAAPNPLKTRSPPHAPPQGIDQQQAHARKTTFEWI
jgi:hypothetical protein